MGVDGRRAVTKPPHPSVIPVIPMTHRASVYEHDGWWFRYVVHRTVGVFIPESSVSFHRTLKGARRAKRRWEARKPKGMEPVA